MSHNFFKYLDIFLHQKTFRSKGEIETSFKDFLASEPLEFSYKANWLACPVTSRKE